MNTLDDLRSTLDRHAAHAVPDGSPVSPPARVAGVRRRARRARRQRTAGVMGAAALVVAGALLVPTLGGDPPPPPVAAAPDTLTALGWTYEQVQTATGGGEVSVRLPVSDTPRLVSWATSGADQEVSVRSPGDGARTSLARDWDDFVWLPPGLPGRVSVAPAGEGEVELAVYELDDTRPPAGVGEGASTFRADVAGRELLGASLGGEGQVSVEVTVPATRSDLWLAELCEGIPRGAVVRIDLLPDGGFISGGCDAAAVFDPGATTGSGYRGSGEPQTLRMSVRRDGRPLDAEELDGARLGLGVYAVSERPVRLAGLDFESPVEHAGHVWEVADTVTGTGDALPTLQVPDDDTYLVRDALRSRGRSVVGIAVDGRTDSSTVSQVGGAGGGARLVGPGREVTVEVGPRTDVVSSALVLYRRVD